MELPKVSPFFSSGQLVLIGTAGRSFRCDDAAGSTFIWEKLHDVASMNARGILHTCNDS